MGCRIAKGVSERCIARLLLTLVETIATQNKYKYQNGCYLINIGHSDFISNVQIIEMYVLMHIGAKYEVSVFKSVARRTVLK